MGSAGAGLKKLTKALLAASTSRASFLDYFEQHQRKLSENKNKSSSFTFLNKLFTSVSDSTDWESGTYFNMKTNSLAPFKE